MKQLKITDHLGNVHYARIDEGWIVTFPVEFHFDDTVVDIKFKRLVTIEVV